MGWVKRRREQLKNRYSNQKRLLKKDTDVLILRKKDLGPEFESLGKDEEDFLESLKPFLSKVSDVRLEIEKISKNTAALQTLIKELGEETLPVSEKELRGRIDELAATTREILNGCHIQLKQLRKQNNEEDQKEQEQLKKLNPEDLTDEEAPGDQSEPEVKRSAGWRIRHNLLEGLLHPKLANAALEYQVVLNEYEKEVKSRARSAIADCLPDATDEEIEDLMEQREEELDQRFANLRELKVQDRALRALQERERDLYRLEQTLNSLHDIMLDMGPMVEQHGGVLDQVEHHVRMADIYTGNGETKIGQTERIINSTRMKKWWIAVAVGVIILIIGAIILCVVGGLILFLVVL
jgi:t-SNARE complex subunit (syntaxin)